MKPVVLVFARYYLPGYRAGGPIRSIANLVEVLGDDFEFRVVTQDRDLGDPRPYPDVRLDTWIRRGKGWVRYVSPDRFGLRAVSEILRTTPHDVIYLNSFFDPCFTQQVLANRYFSREKSRPVVLAPRGEFSSGALRLKHVRKKIYIKVAKMLKLYRDVVWQASSQFEKDDIQRAMSSSISDNMFNTITIAENIAIAPDIVGIRSMRSAEDEVDSSRRQGGPLRLCFLSRISPMKNLDYALRMLSQVRVPISFDIYGPTDDPAYWAQCRALIAAMPSHISVAYRGMVEHADVVRTLSRYDAFLLPTRGENFGHVIHEALHAGLPLLVSDKTPWRQLQEKGVGWDIPLDHPEMFVRRIEELAGLSQPALNQLRENSRAFADQIANAPDVIETNRHMFLKSMGLQSRPCQ